MIISTRLILILALPSGRGVRNGDRRPTRRRGGSQSRIRFRVVSLAPESITILASSPSAQLQGWQKCSSIKVCSP